MLSPLHVGCVRSSKIARYEKPCNVIGVTKHTGSEGKPKDKIEQIESSERSKVRTWSDYTRRGGNRENDFV